jgi:hypothetical protein
MVILCSVCGVVGLGGLLLKLRDEGVPLPPRNTNGLLPREQEKICG